MIDLARKTVLGVFLVVSLIFAVGLVRDAAAQDTGQLKICKAAGVGVAVGTNFTFIVTGANETVTFTVPAGPPEQGGSCVLDGIFDVGTDVTVQETLPIGVEVTAIVVFAPATLKSVNESTGTLVVTIGSGINEVRFVNSATTGVRVSRFAAARSGRDVLVRWRTGTEVDLLGFQAYRSRGHSWRRVTHSLIAARGSVSGASYRFLDRTARRGVPYRYRIKALNRDGTTSWFGPVRVT